MASYRPYKATLTREQFLFHEMRTTAQLINDGLEEEEIIEHIVKDNLFQYPTEKSIKRMAVSCISRLKAMDSDSLVTTIATQPSDIAKQVCLYAMMKQSRLVLDFMLTVIGEKYRIQDTTFDKMDLNVFFIRLQEQDDVVSSWSDATITKIKQILKRVLVENEYLDNMKSNRLNLVSLNSILENAIRGKGEQAILPAFNCFS